MRARKLTLAALALAAGLSLTACQGKEDSAANSNGSGSDSSSSAGTSGGGASEKSVANTSDNSNADESAPGSGGGQISTGPCKTANLDFSTSHGMAEGDLIVSMENTGGDACSLKGFPGVDLMFQDASKGLSAKRSNLAARAVTLKSGEATRFTLHYPPNNTGGTGVHVSSILVTPPDETHSKSLSVSFDIPVQAGAGQKVEVDPVGTGKQ
ncbi:DUF4232 domain-containing protein [Streptomyces sp. CA-250714]|uniref:DUF4232 domain-containing protein n=1 Tax=Streptomyces sp. CA-250714 TaxID=3240060 RepID=UPI003D8E9A4B